MKTAAFQVEAKSHLIAPSIDDRGDQVQLREAAKDRAEAQFIRYAKQRFEEAKLKFDYSKEHNNDDSLFTIDMPTMRCRMAAAGIERGHCRYTKYAPNSAQSTCLSLMQKHDRKTHLLANDGSSTKNDTRSYPRVR